MAETVWSPGDKLKYLDADGKWKYGTVVRIDADADKVYATLDGYPRGVHGCFRSQSTSVIKVEPKRRKQNARKRSN